MYSLIVLQGRSLKSRCQQAWVPSRCSQGECLLPSPSFWLLQVVLVCSCLTSISGPVFTWTPLVHLSFLYLSRFITHQDSPGWFNFRILYYICKNFFSKLGHIHSFLRLEWGYTFCLLGLVWGPLLNSLHLNLKVKPFSLTAHFLMALPCYFLSFLLSVLSRILAKIKMLWSQSQFSKNMAFQLPRVIQKVSDSVER